MIKKPSFRLIRARRRGSFQYHNELLIGRSASEGLTNSFKKKREKSGTKYNVKKKKYRNVRVVYLRADKH